MQKNRYLSEFEIMQRVKNKQAEVAREIRQRDEDNEQMSYLAQWKIDHADDMTPHEIAVMVGGTCFVGCIVTLLCLGALQIYHRVFEQPKPTVTVNYCTRCHSLALQSPPPLATYKQYQKYHPSPAEQRRLLAELVKP